jgi:hypothetical protein
VAHGHDYLCNPDLAEFDPRTLVPTGWDFRTHEPTAPTRERWLSHFRIGAEERAGIAVLAPAVRSAAGLTPEALGQWVALPAYESQPVLRLGLGLVSTTDPERVVYGDFRILLEYESGQVRELFWGRLDNTLWRDLRLPLGRHAGQTFRVIVENISEALLLVDYARIGTPAPSPSRWSLGALSIELVRSDPFLIEADAILNEIGPDGVTANRLLALEGERWQPELRRKAPYPFGELLPTRDPRYLKARQAFHVVTLTEHASMRRAILHRAMDDCLRTVRREGIASMIVPPLLLGSQDLQEIALFARDWLGDVIEWYRTYRPRAFTHLWIPTLVHPIEVHDLYCRIFGELLDGASNHVPLGPEELIRLAGMANLVKAALQSPELGEDMLSHIEQLLEALVAADQDNRATLTRVLTEAGLSERQLLDLLSASYRRLGRLDDTALAAYERLYQLDPAHPENARAMASAYRCRFLVDGERTRAVYEQVFRADAADDENSRFLAAQLLLAGNRETTAMKSLVFERVGLGPSGPQAVSATPALPARPLPPAEPFLHPADRHDGSPVSGQPRSEIFEPLATLQGDSAQPVTVASQQPLPRLLDVLAVEAHGQEVTTSEVFEESPPELAALPAAGQDEPANCTEAADAEPSVEAEPQQAGEPELTTDTDVLLARLAAEIQNRGKPQG